MTKRRGDILAILLLCGIVTIVFADVVIGLRCFSDRDILTFYYPTKAVVRDIVRDGEFPWWNPLYSGGQPLAANPEYEVFYPPQWITLAGDYFTGFRLHILVHFYIAAIGAYLLFRAIPFRISSAIIGALAFALGGLFVSNVNLLPILFPLAWLPWTFLFALRAAREPNVRDVALGAISFGLQGLAFEPVTLMETALLVGAIAFFHARQSRWRSVATGIGIGLWGAAIAAVQIIPMLDLLRDTGRARGFSAATRAWWSFPPERFVEVIFPFAFGAPSFFSRDSGRSALYPAEGGPYYISLYPGALMTILAIVALVFFRRRAATWWVAGLALLLVVVSLGSHGFGATLDSLPVLSMIRFPEKRLLGLSILIAFAAAAGFEALITDSRARKTVLASALVVALAALLFGGEARPSLYVPIATFAAIALGAFFTTRNLALGVSLLIAIAAADLGIVSRSSAGRQPRAFFEGFPPSASALLHDDGAHRLFHQAAWHRTSPTARRYLSNPSLRPWRVRNGLMPHVPARWGIPTVFGTDIDLTNMVTTVDLVDAMWKVRGRNPRWAEIFAAMGNVGYRAAYVPFEEAMAKAKSPVDVQPVVFVPFVRAPRYYFAAEVVEAATIDAFVEALSTRTFPPSVAFVHSEGFVPASGSIVSVRETSSSMTLDVTAAGRAFLVASVTGHRYWKATIDGKAAPLVPVNVAFQGIVIPPGAHRIEMKHRNPFVVAGGVVSLIALAAALATVLRGRSL